MKINEIINNILISLTNILLCSYSIDIVLYILYEYDYRSSNYIVFIIYIRFIIFYVN